MNQITIERRESYGQVRDYPIGLYGAAVRTLTGKKTIDQADQDALTALGFEIRIAALPALVEAARDALDQAVEIARLCDFVNLDERWIIDLRAALRQVDGGVEQPATPEGA